MIRNYFSGSGLDQMSPAGLRHVQNASCPFFKSIIPNLRWGPEYLWGCSCPFLPQCLQSELTPLTHVKCQSCVSINWFLYVWKPLILLRVFSRLSAHIISITKAKFLKKRPLPPENWYLLHGNFSINLSFVRDIRGSLDFCVSTFWVYCASLFCHVNRCKNYSRLHD